MRSPTRVLLLIALSLQLASCASTSQPSHDAPPPPQVKVNLPAKKRWTRLTHHKVNKPSLIARLKQKGAAVQHAEKHLSVKIPVMLGGKVQLDAKTRQQLKLISQYMLAHPYAIAEIQQHAHRHHAIAYLESLGIPGNRILSSKKVSQNLVISIDG